MLTNCLKTQYDHSLLFKTRLRFTLEDVQKVHKYLWGRRRFLISKLWKMITIRYRSLWGRGGGGVFWFHIKGNENESCYGSSSQDKGPATRTDKSERHLLWSQHIPSACQLTTVSCLHSSLKRPACRDSQRCWVPCSSYSDYKNKSFEDQYL